jgi:hypothetical protein
MMLNNRRKFLRTTGLVAGAATLSALPLPATANPATTAEREVSAVISQYGKSIKINRRGSQATEFTVKMRSQDHFSKTFDPLRGLPFERIYVSSGNTLAFNHHGVDFTIINIA